MREVSATLHLQCRNGIWRYYRRVPQYLVPLIGRPFLRHSLKTRIKAEAVKLRTIEDLKADALFDQAEHKLAQPIAISSPAAKPFATPSLEALTEYVRQTVEKLDRRSAERLAQQPPEDADDLKERIQNAGLELTILQRPEQHLQSLRSSVR